jgi:hypothetical protein
MKTQLNEIKRMQQLAGIVSLEEEIKDNVKPRRYRRTDFPKEIPSKNPGEYLYIHNPTNRDIGQYDIKDLKTKKIIDTLSFTSPEAAINNAKSNEKEDPKRIEKQLRQEGFEDINTDFSNIEEGDIVATKVNGVIAEFKGISSSGKYIVVYDMDGSRETLSPNSFKNAFLVLKK